MKIIILIFALCLIFQTAFAQKQDTKLTPSSEISLLTYTPSLNASISDQGLAFMFEKTDRICLKTNNGKQICKSKAVDIARNSGGKHGEGRLPTAYSESLSSPIILNATTGIDRNSKGKHGDGLFPGAYSKNVNKSSRNVLVDDIARNCGGRNSK